MRFHLCFATIALTTLFVSEAARGEVQQAGGWHAPTDNGDRYGGGSEHALELRPAPSDHGIAAERKLRRVECCGRDRSAARIGRRRPGRHRPTLKSPKAPAHCRKIKDRFGASTIFALHAPHHDHDRPEQAIVDWILRETGYETWHSDPVGLLSANHDMLRVYHTPEMQAVVADIVDRFVNSAASAYGFTLRVATVGNPNWRAKALTMMTPIPIQSPGVQGWLLGQGERAAAGLRSELGGPTIANTIRRSSS